MMLAYAWLSRQKFLKTKMSLKQLGKKSVEMKVLVKLKVKNGHVSISILSETQNISEIIDGK